MSYHTGNNNNNNRSSQQRSTPASTPTRSVSTPVTPTRTPAASQSFVSSGEPFAVNGYYPLYRTPSAAVQNSPNPNLVRDGEATMGYHVHVLNNAAYYMPNGLDSIGKQFHGDYTPPKFEPRYTTSLPLPGIALNDEADIWEDPDGTIWIYDYDNKYWYDRSSQPVSTPAVTPPTQRSSSANESASQSLPPANSNTEASVTMTAERAEEIVTVTNILTFDRKIYSILDTMHDLFVGENNYEKTIKDRNVLQAERYIGFAKSFLPEMRAYANHIRTNYDKLLMFDGNDSIPPIRSGLGGSNERTDYWRDVLEDLNEKLRQCFEFSTRDPDDDEIEICNDVENIFPDASDGLSEEEELALCCYMWILVQMSCRMQKYLPCILLTMEQAYAMHMLMLSAAGCDCTTMSGKNDGSGLGTIPTNEPYPGYCRDMCKKAREMRQKIEDLKKKVRLDGCRRAKDAFYNNEDVDCNKFVGEDGFPPRRGGESRSGTGGVGGRNTYENGKRIPGNFPAAYQNSLNKAGPAGQKCGNCKLFNQKNGYCSAWKATANKNYWCQSYVPYVNITRNGAAVSSSGGVFSLRDSDNNLVTYKKGTTVVYDGEMYEVTKSVFGQIPDKSSSFVKITNIDDNVIDGGSFGSSSSGSGGGSSSSSSGGSSSSSSSSSSGGGGY